MNELEAMRWLIQQTGMSMWVRTPRIVLTRGGHTVIGENLIDAVKKAQKTGI